jgi:dTDP-4-amino-4,6-dideoxygalactose transaminase
MSEFGPHDVTREFERALCRYTGAKYAVAVNSCTMALLLAVKWELRMFETVQPINIPRRTYVGVPMSIIHAGGWPTFRDERWSGLYQLRPTTVWDSARLLTSGLYSMVEDMQTVGIGSPLVCVSFHATKTLGIEQGGAILHANNEADAWLRRMRFDGRTAGVPVAQDDIREIGWHCYMNPSTAAQGLMRMAGLKKHNEPLPWDDYPDLSKMKAFQ